MRRIADMGVRFSNFHTTALCSPTRASLLTGRNATIERHGHDRRVQRAASRASPPGSRSRTGSSPRCSPSTATTPTASASGTSRPARSATWPRSRAAGRSVAGFERFYGFLGGEIELLVSRPRPRQPPDRPAGDARGRLPPRPTTSPTRRSSSSATPRSIDPDKPFFMYLAPQAGHAPHHVPEEWADKYKGKFDEGYEAHPRPGSSRARRSSGCCPSDTELSPINPHGEPDAHRSRRPALAAARHRAALGLAQRRRAAAVRPHGRGVRGLHLLLRRPAGPRPRLPRGVGRARQHADRRDLRQRRQRRGWPERQLQRVAVLQRRPRHDRRDAARTSTSSAPRSRTTTTTPAGRGRSTRRSRTGSAGPATRAASPTCAWCPGRRRSPPRREARQQYVHAVDVVPTVYELLGIEPPDVIKGYPQSPIEGESFAAVAHRPDGAGQGDAVLRDARPALDLPRGLARLHAAPAARRLGQVREGRVGALRPRARPRAVEERRRRASRSGSRR